MGHRETTLLGCFLGLCLAPAPAQVTAIAQVSGTVSDPSGAAVANAGVLMTETDKGATRTTTTDISGRYVFPELPVGPYRLEVNVPGFKQYVRSGIVLVVNNNIEINVAMQVGAVSERVEVTAAASQVETKENSVASVIDQQSISELPLNNRQATQLIFTLGASVYADSGDAGSKTFVSSTRIAVAGGQGNGTAYLLDGGDYTDAMSNVNMPMPFPDALQEFSIETSAVSSRFGTHPGATVNAVTKSGSNAFHGDLFEFLRNGDTNARNFFAPAHDQLKRNQFGGTIGGRIIKDKLFFFAGFQGTTNRSVPPQSNTHIPTQAMINGDFSGLGVQLKNPLNGQPFPNDQIPVTMLSPVALALTKYLPISQAASNGFVTYAIPSPWHEYQPIGRVDWVLNDKHSIYGRYFADEYNVPAQFGGNLLLTTTAGNSELAQSATIGDNYTFTQNTLNSFHISFNRVRDNRGPTDTPLSWTQLGSPMYSAVPNFLLISSMSGGFTTFCGTCAPGHFDFSGYQVADDVDLIRGRHQLALGFNLIRVQNNTISGFDENGAPSFNGSFTGAGISDFLLGYMSDFQQTNATPDDLRQWVMSFYAQDSFKVSNRFVLNYGLRWEPTFADPDKYKRGTSFSETAFLAGQVSTVHPSAPPGLFFPGDPGIPPANWNGHLPNFGPRVGVVWDPKGDGKQTLRAGGAILYDSVETWFNERETTNPPYGNDIDVGSTGTLANPWGGYPGGNPFPQRPGALFFPQFGTYINMPINPAPTYVEQWNVTYQRQLPSNWLLSVSYLGNHTTHMWISEERNPAIYNPAPSCVLAGVTYTPCSSTKDTNQRRLLFAYPGGSYYASIDTMDDGASARYQGLLLSTSHRFSQHYQLNANFTDSYCLSDFDFGAALAGSFNSHIFNRHADWGPCISDTRYNFNLTGVANSSWNGGNRWMHRIFSDWGLAPLLQARSGQPLGAISTGVDNSLTGLTGGTAGENDRPVQILPSVYATSPGCSPAPCVQWLNKTAFATPGSAQDPVGSYGNVGRNAIRGPHFVDFDLSLFRTFKMSERYSLQVRAEAFNLFNHPNFVGGYAPSGIYAGTSYGTLSQTLNASNFGQITGAYDPRVMQFAMKLFF
ncbi:MAG TPA: carboxypeptidase-like regulatory domain-containing protein [Bryobacteraceae bacterium]